ncbi:MAG TPA: hypothetical protein VFH11_00840 [Gemmatimonadota bacterium]|nr:hypothetical protein [Gemmatimonadota bacterium]
MHSSRKRFVLLAGIALFAACEESFGPSGMPTALEPAAKPSSNVLYDYEFSGDIQGTMDNVPASASDPFKQVSTGGLSFSFPTASTGDTFVCDQKNPELVPSVNDWGGYDSAPWAGELNLSRRKRSAFHLQISGGQTDGSGSLNLAVNDVSVQDSNDGEIAVLRFDDARALISALSYSETDGGGQADYDSADRCVDFTITATRQF